MKTTTTNRCDYNATRSDIVQVSIDYLVFGDAGYYQIIAGNDEGWAIGPPILVSYLIWNITLTRYYNKLLQ